MTKRFSAAALAILWIAGRVSAADNPQENPSLDKLLGTPVSTAREADHLLSSTAAKYEQELGSVPAAISIITAEEIERYGWTTLDQALQSVPGFYRGLDQSAGRDPVLRFPITQRHTAALICIFRGSGATHLQKEVSV
jgi:outer membrane receptor protein involved in Fe transport